MPKRFLPVFFLLAASLCHSQTNLFMLSIGVKDHRDSTQNLNFADLDAQDLLKAWRGQSVLFRPQDGGMKCLTNSQATLENIRAELAAVKSKVKPGDLFIFFFSGHGNKKGLCPNDYDKKNPGNTVLNFEELRESLRMGCNVLVLLDACYSGKFKDAKDGETEAEPARPDAAELVATEEEMKKVTANMVKLAQGTNYVGLFSSDLNNKSYESDLYKHGYFTQAILNCLAGKPIVEEEKYATFIVSDDGYLPVAEFLGYVQRAYKALSKASYKPQSGESVIYGDGSFQICKIKPESQPERDLDRDGLVPPDDHCPELPGLAADHGCPDRTDRNVDGVVNFEDRCPDEFGTAKAHGCPDADKDGVPDQSDECPLKPGDLDWKGCPDSDGDGVPDHMDRCPDDKGSMSAKGCPPPDNDRDGVANTDDSCPELAGKPEWKGCPDSDGDSFPNHEDLCPQQAGVAEERGCPLPDFDQDGVPDVLDLCPMERGSPNLKGCSEYQAKHAIPAVLMKSLGNHLSGIELRQLSLANPDIRFQQDSLGNVWMLPPADLQTGKPGETLQMALWDWNRQTKKGVVFNDASHFLLPNSALRSPGVAWMSAEKWHAEKGEAESFPTVTPEFVAEFCADSNRVENIKWRMREWMHNGAQVGWLFDLQRQQVHVFQVGAPPSLVEVFNTSLVVMLGAENFQFDLNLLRQGALQAPTLPPGTLKQ